MSAIHLTRTRPGSSGLLAAFGAGSTIMACLLLICVSAFTLEYAGINYYAEGGALIQKVHPGTWMALIAVLFQSLRSGNPVTYLAQTGDRFPGATIFAFLIVMMIVYNSLVQRAPVSLYFDTYLAPVILLWLITELTERQRKLVGIFIHVFMAANALLGIYELLTGFRLTPYVVVGTSVEVIVADWRSSAFLGHPLANSLITAIYVVIVAQAKELPFGRRLAILALQLAAMNAFGGRAATLLLLASLAALTGLRCVAIARGAKFDLRAAVVIVVLGPAVVGLVAALFAGGFFDQFIERFSHDDNSAAARLLMFRLFDKMTLDAFLFGSNNETIFTQQYLEGYEYGIESFWIASIITQGLVMSLLLWLGLFLFLRDVVRSAGARALAPVILTLVIASTSLSFGGKGTGLALLVCFILFLQAPSRSVEAGR